MSVQGRKPHYDKGFALAKIGEECGQLCADKNVAYGDSAATSSTMLKLLYPDGVPPESYDDVLLLTRIWDKMKRIATDKDALGESPYRDIAGYAILGAEKEERKKSAELVKTNPFPGDRD